jgi:hypothetical protein
MSSKNITPDMFKDFPEIEGFNGPYRNQYLKGIAVGKGLKRFQNLEEALEAALANNRCGGITVTRTGIYTLRQKTNLYNSDPKNKFQSIEVTYVKNTSKPVETVESEKKIISRESVLIEEYIENKKNKIDLDQIYERIKYLNQEYYYNIPTRNILDLNGTSIGKLVRGKIVKT